MGKSSLSSEFIQVKGYNNIFTNYNGLRYICKYIKYDYFKKSVKNKNLIFVSPQKWEDPFEKILYNNEQYTIFCMCVTNKSVTNQDAAWWRYSNDVRSKLIRVHYRKPKLLKALDSFASQSGCKVYISKIQYVSQDEIIGKKNELCNSEVDYINNMSLKRRQFDYENEIRIFLVWDKNKHLEDKNKDQYVIPDVDYKGLINRIQIGPHYLYSDEVLMQKAYAKVQDVEHSILKEDIIDVLKENITITKTDLYEYKEDNLNL